MAQQILPPPGPNDYDVLEADNSVRRYTGPRPTLRNPTTGQVIEPGSPAYPTVIQKAWIAPDLNPVWPPSPADPEYYNRPRTETDTYIPVDAQGISGVNWWLWGSIAAGVALLFVMSGEGE